MCIFLFQARTVQIEQLHRTLVKLIAYSAEKLGHFLGGEFLVAYNGIGNHLRLICFCLCCVIKRSGILRIRDNLLCKK